MATPSLRTNVAKSRDKPRRAVVTPALPLSYPQNRASKQAHTTNGVSDCVTNGQQLSESQRDTEEIDATLASLKNVVQNGERHPSTQEGPAHGATAAKERGRPTAASHSLSPNENGVDLQRFLIGEEGTLPPENPVVTTGENDSHDCSTAAEIRGNDRSPSLTPRPASRTLFEQLKIAASQSSDDGFNGLQIIGDTIQASDSKAQGQAAEKIVENGQLRRRMVQKPDDSDDKPYLTTAPELTSPATIERDSIITASFAATTAAPPTQLSTSNGFGYSQSEKADPPNWAEKMSVETVNMPPLPKLPELYADSSSQLSVDTSLPASLPSASEALRPVFGLDNAEEGSPNRRTPDRSGHTRNPTTSTTDSTYYANQFMSDGALYPIAPYRPSPLQISYPIAQLPTMSDHLLNLFMTKAWSDWTLEVISSNAQPPITLYHVHSLVLSRSEVIQHYMHIQQSSGRMERLIPITSPFPIEAVSFEAALKYLYADQLLTRAGCDEWVDRFSKVGVSEEARRMDFILSYWVSGHLLGLQEVVSTGLTLLENSFDWVTTQQAFEAVLAMKAFYASHNEASLPGAAVSPRSSPTKSVSPLPNGYHSPTSTNFETLRTSTQGNEMTFAFLDSFMRAITAGTLELSLKGFQVAKESSEILRSYLPDLQDRSRTRNQLPHRPALASITFGSMPSTTVPTQLQQRPKQLVFSSGQPSSEYGTPSTKTLSAILLNLPFEDLNYLFSAFLTNFDETQVLEIFEKVIEVREAKRKLLLGQTLISNNHASTHPRVWDIAGRTEMLHRDGKNSKLSSHWAGFDEA